HQGQRTGHEAGPGDRAIRSYAPSPGRGRGVGGKGHRLHAEAGGDGGKGRDREGRAGGEGTGGRALKRWVHIGHVVITKPHRGSKGGRPGGRGRAQGDGEA